MNTEKRVGLSEQLNTSDIKGITAAKKAYLEYINAFAMADNTTMNTSENALKEAVAKLSPDGKELLKNYFSSLPESDRPEAIALKIE